MRSALIFKIIGLECVQFEFETSSSKTCVTVNISQRPTDDTGVTIWLAPSVNGTDRHPWFTPTLHSRRLSLKYFRAEFPYASSDFVSNLKMAIRAETCS